MTRKQCALFLAALCFSPVFSISGADDSFPASSFSEDALPELPKDDALPGLTNSGNILTTPSPEEQRRLQSDPFYRQFRAAFDEVTGISSITASDLSGENGEEFSSLLSEDSDLRAALLDAFVHRGVPGHKAFRNFSFEPNARGELKFTERSSKKAVFDMSQGEIVRTGRKTDLAIKGSGFFPLMEAKNTSELPLNMKDDQSSKHLLFSRAGNFLLDEEGFLYLERPGQTPNDEPIRYYLYPKTSSMAEVPYAQISNAERLTSDDGVFFRAPELPDEAVQKLYGSKSEIGAEPPEFLHGFLELSNGRYLLIEREISENIAVRQLGKNILAPADSSK